jgi:hypothetical protein
MLLEDIGIDPSHANIDLDKDQLKLTIQTTRSNYTRVSDKVRDLLKNEVKHLVTDVSEDDGHYISCINDGRIKKDFKKKFEDKYNVKLMERVKVQLNQGGDPGHRGSRGG